MFQVSNSGSNSECGISERTRIVGGPEATPGEWPWAVIVGKPKESSFQVESKYILNLNRCRYFFTSKTTGGHLIEFHLIESVDRIFRSNA